MQKPTQAFFKAVQNFNFKNERLKTKNYSDHCGFVKYQVDYSKLLRDPYPYEKFEIY